MTTVAAPQIAKTNAGPAGSRPGERDNGDDFARIVKDAGSADDQASNEQSLTADPKAKGKPVSAENGSAIGATGHGERQAAPAAKDPPERASKTDDRLPLDAVMAIGGLQPGADQTVQLNLAPDRAGATQNRMLVASAGNAINADTGAAMGALAAGADPAAMSNTAIDVVMAHQKAPAAASGALAAGGRPVPGGDGKAMGPVLIGMGKADGATMSSNTAAPMVTPTSADAALEGPVLGRKAVTEAQRQVIAPANLANGQGPTMPGASKPVEPGLVSAMGPAAVTAGDSQRVPVANIDISRMIAGEPDGAARLAETIANNVARASVVAVPGKQISVLRLQLQPAHLGQINVTMRLSGGTVHVQLATDNAAAARTLSADTETIATALRSIGTFSAASVDVATDAGGRALVDHGGGGDAMSRQAESQTRQRGDGSRPDNDRQSGSESGAALAPGLSETGAGRIMI